MEPLSTVAPAFVAVAHRVVCATMATVDPAGRPSSRTVHPVWDWDGEQLTGWVGALVTPSKRAHLQATPYASSNYWDPAQDVATAECRALAAQVVAPGLLSPAETKRLQLVPWQLAAYRGRQRDGA